MPGSRLRSRHCSKLRRRGAGFHRQGNPRITMFTQGARQAANSIVQRFVQLMMRRRLAAKTGDGHETMPALQKTLWLGSQDDRHLLVDEGVLLQTVCGQLRQGVPAAGETKAVSLLPVMAGIASFKARTNDKA